MSRSGVAHSKRPWFGDSDSAESGQSLMLGDARVGLTHLGVVISTEGSQSVSRLIDPYHLG